MLKIIKKMSLHKKTLFLVLGMGLFLSLAPLHSAQAAVDIWGIIAELLTDIPNFIAGGVTIWFLSPVLGFIVLKLAIGLGISAFSFILSILFLQWVVSGYYITLPFTHGGIVDTGWQWTQTLANLAFILVLVFIGLATTLRMENYGLKKMLPRFLIAVILINFSKVIAGAIIDIANIIQGTFFSFDFKLFFNIFNPFSEEINKIKKLFGGDISAGINIVKDFITFSGILSHFIKYTLAIFYGFFASFVFWLYSFLFIFRYIAIWFLVILAPIAWACMVLPVTQKYWKMWWEYFLQWAFVGAIAGFFLKLGSEAMSALSGKFMDISKPQVACSGGGDACFEKVIVSLFNFILQPLNEIAVSMAVLTILIIGFFLSIKMSKGGTELFMKWGQKAGMAVGIWAGAKGMSWARSRVPEGWRMTAERMAAAPTPAGGGAIGSLFGMARRGIGGATLKAITGTEEEQANKAADLAKKKGRAENLGTARQTPSQATRSAVLATMLEKGQITGAIDPVTGAEINPVTNDEIIAAYRYARQRGKADTAEKFEQGFLGRFHTNPALRTEFIQALHNSTQTSLDPLDRTDMATGLSPRDTANGYRSFEHKIIAGAKSADEIKRLSLGWYLDDDAMEAVHMFWGGNQIGEATKVFGSDFANRIQRTAHGINWYVNGDPATGFRGNLSVPRYLASGAAQGLGMNPLQGAETTEQINRLAENARISRLPSGSTERMQGEIRMWNQELRDLQATQGKTSAQSTRMEILQNQINSHIVSLAGPGADGIRAEINTRNQRLEELRKVVGPSASQSAEISRLENEIDQRLTALGARPRPDTEEDMVNEINQMTSRINTLRGRTERTGAEDTEITMLETAIKNLRQRMGRTPQPTPKQPVPPPPTPREIEAKMANELRDLMKRRGDLNKLSFQTEGEKEELKMVENSIDDISKRLGVEIPQHLNVEAKLRELNLKLGRGQTLTPDELALRTILESLRRPPRRGGRSGGPPSRRGGR